MTDEPKVLHLSFDAAETAVLMLEAYYQVKRPMPDATEALRDGMEEDERDAWLRAADAVLKYFIGELTEGHKRMGAEVTLTRGSGSAH